MIEFIHNIWWLDMFRTSIVHPQERLQAVCCKFGMWYFAYCSILPDVIPPPPSVMNKLNHKTLCIWLVYISIELQ